MGPRAGLESAEEQNVRAWPLHPGYRCCCCCCMSLRFTSSRVHNVVITNCGKLRRAEMGLGSNDIMTIPSFMKIGQEL